MLNYTSGYEIVHKLIGRQSTWLHTNLVIECTSNICFLEKLRNMHKDKLAELEKLRNMHKDKLAELEKLRNMHKDKLAD